MKALFPFVRMIKEPVNVVGVKKAAIIAVVI